MLLPGQTIFQIGDIVSEESFNEENERVKKLGLKPATSEILKDGKWEQIPQTVGPSIIHEATSENPNPAELMPVDVPSAFPKGASSTFNTREKAQIDRFINEVPDKNDTRAINYWLDWGDRKVYLEGWIDKCLAGTDFPPMEGGEWDEKIEYMVRVTHRTLIEKQEEKNRPLGMEPGFFRLVEGGFREFEAGDKEWLYGVTWGVYAPEVTTKQLSQTVGIEGGEPIPSQYRDLIGFISEALPEYSLAVLPAIDVAGGERKIDTVMKQLKDGVEGIQDSAQFRLFLTTMAKFHDYSIGNLILIGIQKPNATKVAGFNTWKDLGRWVNAGEKGIAILAPILPPRPTCPRCDARIPKGARFCPKCGEPVEIKEETEEVRFFKVVYVFDIGQTEGKPLPEFEVPVLTGEANEQLFAKVMALAKAQGLEVSFESRPEQRPSIKGQYFAKTIWVRPEEPRAQQLKSLIHELAHYYSESVFSIPNAETIAESAAFVVGVHYGFDSGVRSFPYVALWAQDKKVLQDNLASIRKVATVILESLEKMPETSEKLLPALKPFEPYKFCDYVLRNNVFSDKETFIYSGLSGINPLRVPDHYWAEALAAMGGEFVKTGDLYVVHTPGVERPPTMRAAPTWRELSGELSLETIELLAETEGDPLRKFCCRICGECAPKELLEEGKFPERIAWLRHHYKEKHPGMWGKHMAAQSAVISTESTPAPNPEEELEFVADSPEFLAYTIDDIGYREKLDNAFKTAIARAKGG